MSCIAGKALFVDIVPEEMLLGQCQLAASPRQNHHWQANINMMLDQLFCATWALVEKFHLLSGPFFAFCVSLRTGVFAIKNDTFQMDLDHFGLLRRPYLFI